MTQTEQNRRKFLLALSVGATAVAAGCTSSTTSQSPTSSATATSTTPPSSTTLIPSGPQDLKDLPNVVLPGSANYASSAQDYNPLFDGNRPAAISYCKTPADVQACVSFASTTKSPIAARSGGHSYVGYSNATSAVVADVTGLNAISFGAGTVTIGSGAKLGAVYSAFAKQGVCVPAGSCPTVGIAGLTLGGGVGVLTPKYGLTCDLLESAQIVTADGKLRTVSGSSDSALFWALRGGGGGNFGVVTAFTFKTNPAPSVSTVSLHFAAVDAAAVIDGWQKWLPSAQDEFWTKLFVTGGTNPTARISGCFAGTAAAANSAVNSLLGSIGVQTTSRIVTYKSYGDAMAYFAGGSNRDSFVGTSRILTKAVDSTEVIAAAQAAPTAVLMFDALGGAVARVKPADTAFAYRSALGTVQIYASATTATQADAHRRINAARDRLGQAVGDTGYVNYIDASMPNWATAYYGSNLARLRKTAATYDPDHVFKFAQGLG